MDITESIRKIVRKTVNEFVVEKVKSLLDNLENQQTIENYVNEYLRGLLREIVKDALENEGLIQSAAGELYEEEESVHIEPSELQKELIKIYADDEAKDLAKSTQLFAKSLSNNDDGVVKFANYSDVKEVESGTLVKDEIKPETIHLADAAVNAYIEDKKEAAKEFNKKLAEKMDKPAESDVKKDEPKQPETKKEEPKNVKDNVDLQKAINIKRIHIRMSEINEIAKPLGIKYDDEKYRTDLDRMYGVKSSKDLSYEQSEEFVNYLLDIEKNTKELLAKKKNQAIQKELESKEPALVEEAQEVFDTVPGQPSKDLMEDARIRMWKEEYKAGKPLTITQYRKIGVDPSKIPDHLIKTFPGEKQESLFSDNELPF